EPGKDAHGDAPPIQMTLQLQHAGWPLAPVPSPGVGLVGAHSVANRYCGHLDMARSSAVRLSAAPLHGQSISTSAETSFQRPAGMSMVALTTSSSTRSGAETPTTV